MLWSADARHGGIALGMWRVAAATVTGPSHLRREEAGQDAFAVTVVDNWLVAAVSDGAGSAPFGGEGSSFATKAIVSTISALLASGAKDLARLPSLGIANAREGLASLAGDRGVPLAHFHCTALGAIIGATNGVFFHIGDGAAVAMSSASGSLGWDAAVVSAPENGEYLDETFFQTQDIWESKLRITEFERADAAFLMTDGVTGFAMQDRYLAPDIRFLGAVHTHLSGRAPAVGGEALARTLDRADARAASSDDKTLMWIQRETLPL